MDEGNWSKATQGTQERMTDIPSKRSKLGLREIAAAAHVSIATVSRVLNGSSRVDPAIRKSVLAAAADLDIDFSQRNKTKALAFLLSNRSMQHVFHSGILLGAEAYCASRNWELIFQSFNYPSQVSGRELHLPNVVQRHDIVRGVILAGTNSPNLLELLNYKNIPFVVLGNNVISEVEQLGYVGDDVVFSNDIQGGQDVTRHLISLGHCHIWFVGNIRLPWFARCFEGYRRAMEEAGLPPRLSTVDLEDETDIGYLGTKSLLAKGEPVTAIFAGNDPTAHGVYKGLRDGGLDIPGDISVVGCDDTVGSWLYPALTTIREFPELLGKQMVELLINRITNPGQARQQVTLPTELIKRESCRPISSATETSTAATFAHTTI
ncbi:LacI family DNA-binding transcriptional regulator [Acidicapsa acidisoli]|uniref:LacI family DNA-binding transcriptional regulator n=1 Tax=Acidicapsa acidisoli TaxID=1615681 RepID=UPI0021E07566|nr:LacI family DNA-binding transcriptional regulator [Acidicapsa acidisoli]